MRRRNLLGASCGVGGCVCVADAVVGVCEVGNARAGTNGRGEFLDVAVLLLIFRLLCGVDRLNASIACTRPDGGV